jgi:hypothetical protein
MRWSDIGISFGPEDYPDTELSDRNLPFVVKISIGRHKVAKTLIDRGASLNLIVTPRSEKEGMKPPYVCPGCSNHTYGQQYGEQIQYLVKFQTRIFTK